MCMGVWRVGSVRFDSLWLSTATVSMEGAEEIGLWKGTKSYGGAGQE